jgi:hypothetical protein
MPYADNGNVRIHYEMGLSYYLTFPPNEGQLIKIGTQSVRCGTSTRPLSELRRRS